jgi:hypothetical protein
VNRPALADQLSRLACEWQGALKGGSPDWDAILGLMEDAIYGGRIDNPHDGRVLKTYLKK